MLQFKLDYIDKEVLNFCSCIIKKYLDRNKIFDEKFIIECVEEIKKIKCINDYIERVIIDNDMDDTGNYQMITKDMSFNVKRILNLIEEDKDFFGKEYKIYKYIRVLVIVLHELEHANQRKKMLTDNALESKILIASLCKNDRLANELIKSYLKDDEKKKNVIRTKIAKHHNIYKKFYKFAPEERMAYIKSKYLASKIASLYELDFSSKYFEFLSNLIGGEAYLETVSPTSFYLKKMNINCNVRKIEKLGKNLDLSERFLYGLTLSEEEINCYAEEIVEFHKSYILK